MTIRVSDLTAISAVIGNVMFPAVSNIAGSLTTVRANVDVIGEYLLADTIVNISAIESNVLVLQGNVNALTANAATQQSLISNLQVEVTSTSSNVITLFGQVAVLTSGLSSNVSSLTGLINNAEANITQANLGMVGYVTNAVSTANIGVIGYIDQANTIQADGIVAANVGMKGYVDVQIAALANIDVGAISNLSANVSSLTTAVANLDSNVTSLTSNVSNLTSNIVTITSNVANLNITTSILTSNLSILTNTVSNISITVSDIVGGNVQFSDVIPAADTVYMLGSVSNQWSEIYASATNTTNIQLGLGGEIYDTNVGTYNSTTILGPDGGSSTLAAISANAAVNNYLEVNSTHANIQIYNDNTSTLHLWKFEQTGNIIFPDTTQQSTAFTATFANATPSSANDTGIKGDIVYDASYVYICVATNSWIRAARTSW